MCGWWTEWLAGLWFLSTLDSVATQSSFLVTSQKLFVLMHATYPWTYDAVKLLLDPQAGYLKMHNFRVGTVEDAVCWKYGKHSWELVSQTAGQKRDPN